MPTQGTEQDAAELTALLGFLKDSRGFDFSGYKRASLSRRIQKRMQAVGVTSYAEYADYLETSPREFTELFNTILINVTSFFRDPHAWDHIAKEVVPRLLEETPPELPLRVWSAGCASGEEAYSAAMVLAEAMGQDAFRDRVKIYGTDLDEEALNAARHAVYSHDALKAVPDELVDRYFEPSTSGLAFRQELRRSVIFGRNDLVADAPISRIDLLLCRNVLMYFTPEAQAQIVQRFNFALKPSGVLFLGKSEMLVSHRDLFAPENLKWHTFRKVASATVRDRLAFVGDASEGGRGEGLKGIRSAAAALAPVGQIVVDRKGVLVDANLRARELFSLGAADIGRPFQDLSLSYRPADLRSAIDDAYKNNEGGRLGRVEWARAPGDERMLDIEVAVVPGPGRDPLGVTIIFTDVTLLARLSDDYERSSLQLETAYEEVQSTVEELETTNEELQSTNEELETTNEELQSANEELETMNEELQSTNDELETMNEEVNSRAIELDRVNLFLEGLLGSLGVGVVVMDRERNVQAWNTTATELWGALPVEVEGRDFLTLDIGLPVHELGEPLARVLAGEVTEFEQRYLASNRRGGAFECNVRVKGLATRAGDIYGAMVLMSPVAGSGDR